MGRKIVVELMRISLLDAYSEDKIYLEFNTFRFLWNNNFGIG
jgi:hypothetical protein